MTMYHPNQVATSPSQVFPTYSSAQRPITKESVLAKFREKRAALKAQNQS